MYSSALHGKKVLITAGPTREAIDPVRYISNHSSGRMGYAIAESLLQQGAVVYLVSGPVCIDIKSHPNLHLIQVTTASEMYLACWRYFSTVDIAVFAAAVADYRPEKVAKQKIKKNDSSFEIKMVKNTDIAAEFGKVKMAGQLSVGFALETENELGNAVGKLNKKNFDLVIMNSMNDANAGFGYDTNKVSIINRQYIRKDFSLKSKKEVAKDIVDEISNALSNHTEQFIERSVYEYENMYR